MKETMSFTIGMLMFTVPFTAITALSRFVKAGAGGSLITVLCVLWLVAGLAVFIIHRRENKYMALGFLIGGILPSVMALIINNGIITLM